MLSLSNELPAKQAMVQFSSLFSSLARNISIKNETKSQLDVGREAADTLAREARKKFSMLSSPGCLNSKSSQNFISVYSRRGKKGLNQDCFIVWEEFGCQEDMTFCGIFDGHGPWGHLVAKRVRELMPSSLLCKWQEIVALNFLKLDVDLVHLFDIWKQSFLKTCSAIDKELEQQSRIDSFYSGTTALTIVQQGDLLVLANVGDSRAVLATTADDGTLISHQLTIDLKPNLPQERERITKFKGKVCSAQDEPGVYRVWMPRGEALEGPGLAISRAFGDYYIKDFGLTSEPEVTWRSMINRDKFVILATDGLWDVITNQEAVEIVSSTPEREKSAKRLIDCAVCAWKSSKQGIAMDDISVICLFFGTAPLSEQSDSAELSKMAA